MLTEDKHNKEKVIAILKGTDDTPDGSVSHLYSSPLTVSVLYVRTFFPLCKFHILNRQF